MNDERDRDTWPGADDSANTTSGAPGDQSAGAEGGRAGGTGWARGWSSADASAGAQQFLAQLQSMIDNIATQSAPVVREIGAKAAELAAIAAERAGPLAQRAAEVTQDVGSRVAERSRGFAEELRRQQEGRPGPGDMGTAGSKGPDTDDGTAPSGV
jgi:hypothetical protein